jgi:hypothetical protein
MVVTESESVPTYVVEKSLEVSEIDFHFLNQGHLFRAHGRDDKIQVTSSVIEKMVDYSYEHIPRKTLRLHVLLRPFLLL